MPSPKRKILIEVPRGSFLKREGQKIEYISPIPSPFNYGCIEGEVGEDGDPPDVVLLGPPVPFGSRQQAEVVGRVDFLDAGRADPKLIASFSQVTPAERRRVERFFRFYAPIRRLLNIIQGNPGETRFLGVEWKE